MKKIITFVLFAVVFFAASVAAQTQVKPDNTNNDAHAAEAVEKLDKPLYTPFIERYVLDELRSLRKEQGEQRAMLIEKMTDKELSVADRSMSYAVDTITYFFYVIAAVSALLVILGWNSMREVKEKVEQLAHQEVARITETFEARLNRIEEELHQKSENIRSTQRQITITNEIHSLWLKASQESQPQNKIAIYDQILAIKPDDTEALTYKADAALSLGETEWARSLCDRALAIDPENGHAYYQRACANAEAGAIDEAMSDLKQAITIAPAFRGDAVDDSSFDRLKQSEDFIQLTSES